MTRLIQFVLCCIVSSAACAQLTETTIVINRVSAPPSSASGWTDIAVSCPNGLIALSGGVIADSSAIEITTSAPSFVDASLFSQPDGPHAAATGWYASVKNFDSGAHPVALSVLCSSLPRVVVSISSAMVSAGTSAQPGIGSLIAQCPSNYSAIGGGVDLHLPATMYVAALSPTFGLQYLADRPVGAGGAPTGWNANARNEGAASLMKVAAVCTPSSGISSVITAPFFVGPGAAAGMSASCPAGTLALSGGLDSPDYTKTAAVASTPLLSGNPSLPIDRAAGSYTSATGWYGIYFNYGPGSATVRVAAVCAALNTTDTVVYEFFNSGLKHYFRTANAAEAAAIDNGAAGPNWVRTGDNFFAFIAGSTAQGTDVCRFYAPSQNSHFFTAFASECASLKAPSSGWNYEGLSFRILLPNGASCVAGTKPVYRLYNNRFAANDSNHRFTTDFANVGPMQSQGWTYEGVAFCALVL